MCRLSRNVVPLLTFFLTVTHKPIESAKSENVIEPDRLAFVGSQEVIMDPSDPVRTKESSLVPFFHSKMRSYAGFFEIQSNNDTGKLFSWFFPNSNATAPLIVWLQGQPGVSALYGLFEEHGPFEIDKVTLTVTKREYTLTNLYHVLYLDPDTNCGYSSSKIHAVTDPYYTQIDHVSGQIFETLQNFFKIFFEYKNNHLYLAGQSASDWIIPRIVRHIDYASLRDDQVHMNLKGILIGGGLFRKSGALHYVGELFTIGIIDIHQRDRIIKQEHLINALLRAQHNEEALDRIGSIVADLKKRTGFRTIYDVRDPLATLRSVLPRFLRQSSMNYALHVGNQRFSVKKQTLIRDLLSPISTLYTDVIGRTRVLLYNGQFDFFSSYAETDVLLSYLLWGGTEHYYKTRRKIWREDGHVIGYWKTYGNLTHALIRNAGHWVGQTQPRAFCQLVDKFIENKLD